MGEEGVVQNATGTEMLFNGEGLPPRAQVSISMLGHGAHHSATAFVPCIAEIVVIRKTLASQSIED